MKYLFTKSDIARATGISPTAVRVLVLSGVLPAPTHAREGSPKLWYNANDVEAIAALYKKITKERVK